MAGIDVGGAGGHGGGRRAQDFELPLVPFIDLFFVTIMFLLATAVWSNLALLQATQESIGPQGSVDAPPDALHVVLHIDAGGYDVATNAGDHHRIPRNGGAYDIEALRRELHAMLASSGRALPLVLSADDGIAYEHVVAALDSARGAGYQRVRVQAVR